MTRVAKAGVNVVQTGNSRRGSLRAGEGSHEFAGEPVHVGVERVPGLGEDLLQWQPLDRFEFILVEGGDVACL
ncbi:MAG: hypothetical protein QOI83_3861 [Streptomycetaceae bacterium]|nr:hypothetical protein [Streptomycetaceae bacterium]